MVTFLATSDGSSRKKLSPSESEFLKVKPDRVQVLTRLAKSSTIRPKNAESESIRGQVLTRTHHYGQRKWIYQCLMNTIDFINGYILSNTIPKHA